MRVAAVEHHEQGGGDADIRLGQPGEKRSERHPRTQSRDTETEALISPGMDEAIVSR